MSDKTIWYVHDSDEPPPRDEFEVCCVPSFASYAVDVFSTEPVDDDPIPRAALIAAAGTAAHELAQQGCDPVSAFKALPDIIRHLQDIKPKSPSYSVTDALLDRIAGNGGDDGTS